MAELHPTQCACQDCRSRRLIRDDAVAAGRDERAARLKPALKAAARVRNGQGEVQSVAKL